MSDSVSGADVEDVLASVRRLISNDGRGTRVAPAKAASSGDGRLLLTPALRVEGSHVPQADAEPELTGTDDTVPATEVNNSLEQRIAELEAAVSRSPGDWEPDGSEDQAQHRPRRMIRSRDPDAPHQPPLKLSRLAPVEMPLDAGPVIDDAFRLVEDDDPDAIEDAEIVSTIPPAQAVDDADLHDDDEELADEEREPRTARRVRELYGDELDDEVFADEALRLLVSALIREELQGELGERITRNVRKLVRREIQRALAARDLS